MPRPVPVPSSRGLESAFRWRLRLKLERSHAYLRAAGVVAWLARVLFLPLAPRAPLDPRLTVAVLAILWAAAILWLLHRWPELARRAWPGYAIGDFVLILAAIAVTGPTASPLLPLLFMAALSVPYRLPLGGGVAAGAIATAAWIALAPAAQRWEGALVGLLAGMQVMGTLLVRADTMETARDPLTGCFGRGQITTEIRRMVGQRAYPFALILADLDHFKAVNDLFGHMAGDRVLQAAARHIAASIRGADLLARYGGDEFLVVMAATDGPTATAVAERVRGAIAGGRFDLGTGAGIALTLSAGVIEAHEGQRAEELMAAVDSHLYEARRVRAAASAS